MKSYLLTIKTVIKSNDSIEEILNKINKLHPNAFLLTVEGFQQGAYRFQVLQTEFDTFTDITFGDLCDLPNLSKLQLIKTCEEGASSCDTPLPPPMNSDPVDSAWYTTSTTSNLIHPGLVRW